jgi:hypothetical protein
MEQYTVNRQWLLGKNGKQYRGGDPVTSAQVANIDELVANGSLIPSKEVENVIDVKAVNNTLIVDKPILFTFENEKGETIEVRSDEDVSKPEIIALLDSIEPKIDFKKGDKKPVLFELYLLTLNKESEVESDEPILFTFEGENSETIEVKSIKDIDKDQLVVLLGKSLVAFNPADEIEVLFDLYLE